MIEQDLKDLLEQEEFDTVSDAFGGDKTNGSTKSYSVTKVRDAILKINLPNNGTPLQAALVESPLVY